MGLLDAPSLSPTAADARYGRLGYRSSILAGHAVVAGRPNGMCLNIAGNLCDGTNTSGNFRYLHPVLVGATGIRLLYVNWYNGDTVGPNSISVKASVEWPGITGTSNNGQVGAKIPVYFRGARTVTIEPGGYALSDPIEMSPTPGQNIFTRTYVSVASAGQK